MRYFLPLIVAVTATFVCAPGALGQPCDPIETHKLLAGDGALNDVFGSAVALSGTTTIVGAPFGVGPGGRSGSAYLFDTVSGTQLHKLVPNDGASADEFGYSVAISGNIALVGAYRNDDHGLDSGSAYLFDITTGMELAKLLPDDGAAGDFFGWSVALDGTTAVIGAYQDDDNGSSSGSAYLFDVTSGLQIHKLLPDDGAGGDTFGRSVAISGPTVIVGAPNDDDNGSNSGSAYYFAAGTGVQLAKLLAADGANFDSFGLSVAIHGGRAIVGAPEDDDNGTSSGSAYLFDSAGIQTAKLITADGAAGDSLGWTVGISGDTVIAAAGWDDDLGSSSGAAYLFDVNSGLELHKLLASDGAANDQFGKFVALDNTTAVIGAYHDDDNGPDSGSAYLFDIIECDCLNLTVDNLVAGEQAVFTLSGGTAGAKGVTVYGTQAGQTAVNNFAGYCATFGIKGVNQKKVIGGLNRTFDDDGEITFNLNIPGGVAGLSVLFQSAERGTCPDECMSNLVDAVVQ